MSEQASSPAAEDTSAPGLATEAPAANETDDLSTDHLDRIEAEDENEAAVKARKRDEGEGGEAEGDAPAEGAKAAVDDGLVEVEAADGSKVRVPAALKDDFLRHADYTRKTQEVADKARALETDRQTWQQQQEDSRAALPEEYAKVAVASREVTQAEVQVAEFEKIDWATWRAQTLSLPDDDPNKVNYRQYRAAYDAARETLTDAQRELGSAKTDLSAKEQTRLTEREQAQETALASARQQTGEALKAEGWDQQRLSDVAGFAVTELGYAPEELLNAVDPRAWRMADALRQERAKTAKLEAQLKKTTTADANLKDQASRPAEPAKGNAQPVRARDDNSTDTWMDRRNRQVAAKQAAARAAR